MLRDYPTFFVPGIPMYDLKQARAALARYCRIIFATTPAQATTSAETSFDLVGALSREVEDEVLSSCSPFVLQSTGDKR